MRYESKEEKRREKEKECLLFSHFVEAEQRASLGFWGEITGKTGIQLRMPLDSSDVMSCLATRSASKSKIEEVDYFRLTNIQQDLESFMRKG